MQNKIDFHLRINAEKYEQKILYDWFIKHKEMGKNMPSLIRETLRIGIEREQSGYELRTPPEQNNNPFLDTDTYAPPKETKKNEQEMIENDSEDAGELNDILDNIQLNKDDESAMFSSFIDNMD